MRKKNDRSSLDWSYYRLSNGFISILSLLASALPPPPRRGTSPVRRHATARVKWRTVPDRGDSCSAFLVLRLSLITSWPGWGFQHLTLPFPSLHQAGRLIQRHEHYAAINPRPAGGFGRTRPNGVGQGVAESVPPPPVTRERVAVARRARRQ